MIYYVRVVMENHKINKKMSRDDPGKIQKNISEFIGEYRETFTMWLVRELGPHELSETLAYHLSNSPVFKQASTTNWLRLSDEGKHWATQHQERYPGICRQTSLVEGHLFSTVMPEDPDKVVVGIIQVVRACYDIPKGSSSQACFYERLIRAIEAVCLESPEQSSTGSIPLQPYL
jgi:hypothetical protein